MRRLMSVAALTAALACAAPALAQDAQDAQREAVRLSADARTAFDEGRVMDAIVAYEQAFDLAPDPAFAYNLAALYEAVENLPRALAWYRAYLEIFPEAPNEPQVRDAIARVLRTLDTEWSLVSFGAEPATARVFVVEGENRYFLAETPFEEYLPPGRLTFQFERTYYFDETVDVALAAGGQSRVDVAMQPEQIRWRRLDRRCTLAPTTPGCP